VVYVYRQKNIEEDPIARPRHISAKKMGEDALITGERKNTTVMLNAMMHSNTVAPVNA
jgi:hypothetical protein